MERETCQRFYALSSLGMGVDCGRERRELRTMLSSQAEGLRRHGAADGNRELEGRPS